jgi:Protein of unknown function (DUF4232)
MGMKTTIGVLAIAGAAVAACGSTPSSLGVTAPSSAPMSSPMSSSPMMTPSKTPAKTPSMASSSAPMTPMTTPPMSGGTPECTTSDVKVSINAGNGAAGTIYYELTFTNTSMGNCTMDGYPGVVAAGMNGDLGASAVREAANFSTVTVTPGAKVSAQLAYKDAKTTEMGCNMAQASELKIIPPNRFDSLTVPFNGQVCSSMTVPVLYIWPVT